VAYDVLADGLARHPSDVRLRQLLGLALSRTGASRSAIGILERLKDEGHADEETLGLLARAHKDLWSRCRGSAEGRRHLRLAHRYYREAHDRSHGIWSGINAATTALLLGDRKQAHALACHVRGECLLPPGAAADYWRLATLGEAALILQDWCEAEAAYTRAFEIGKGRPGDIAATRRNARLVVRELGLDDAPIEEWLQVPRVVAFAGHMVDRPGREAPRFPQALETAARAEIRKRLGAMRAGFGYASAACGGDILFLESLAEIGAEATVVLPYNSEQFVKDSVDIVPGGGWRERYARILAAAREVVTASEQRMAGGQLSYDYAVLLLDGMAGIRADELDTELVPLVLWDRREEGGVGGTAFTVARWRETGRRVEVIDLSKLLYEEHALIVQPPNAAAPSSEAPGDSGAGPGLLEPRIVCLLFADVRGFSRLTEEQIPPFVQHFLGMVADLLTATSRQPVLRNTWGDGLYFVFERVSDAGQFALELSAAINRTDWTAHGLPADFSLRIGLHAGPAYACIDPVTGRPNYLGGHVSRAARIEPITPPGQVYASRAFAALARAHQVTGFSCEYVGRTTLPKGSGTLPMYVVREPERSR
jgi:class 3 adenylate cyclase